MHDPCRRLYQMSLIALFGALVFALAGVRIDDADCLAHVGSEIAIVFFVCFVHLVSPGLGLSGLTCRKLGDGLNYGALALLAFPVDFDSRSWDTRREGWRCSLTSC